MEGADKSDAFPLLMGVAGVTVMFSYNWIMRRPPYASIYKHVACGAIGYYAGGKLVKVNERQQKQKLLVLQDYIDRHPEDFIEPERKKFKDILHPWFPIRGG